MRSSSMGAKDTVCNANINKNILFKPKMAKMNEYFLFEYLFYATLAARLKSNFHLSLLCCRPFELFRPKFQLANVTLWWQFNPFHPLLRPIHRRFGWFDLFSFHHLFSALPFSRISPNVCYCIAIQGFFGCRYLFWGKLYFHKNMNEWAQINTHASLKWNSLIASLPRRTPTDSPSLVYLTLSLL